MIEGYTQYNRTVAEMVRYLDREAINERCEKRLRNSIRRLKSPTLRKFALALVKVMTTEKGPEICTQKKVCYLLKIHRSAYFLLRYQAEKMLK